MTRKTEESDPQPSASSRRRVPRVRIHHSIARDLGIQLVAGNLKPGDVLPIEVDASERLGVSRTAYREAIRMLVAKGLVESKPKTGTRVSPAKHWNLLDPEVLSWIFESDPPDAFVQGLFELRMVVEPAAAAFAAERRSDAQLERMRNALVIMQAKTLATEAGRAADRDFHDIVLEATGNASMVSLSSSIGSAVRWTTIFKYRRKSPPHDPLPEHWKVFDAIAASRPDLAREAMARLVNRALDDTRAALKTT